MQEIEVTGASDLALLFYTKCVFVYYNYTHIYAWKMNSCLKFKLLIMIIFQSTWPQLDISPFSYQSYSVIALTLRYLVVPIFTVANCFCLAYPSQYI